MTTPAPALSTVPSIAEVRVEYGQAALGIGVAGPRLSWLVAATGDWRQVAHELQLIGSDGRPRASTGRIKSAESVLVSWPFAPLASRERVAVRVRAWASDGRRTDWSAPTWLEAGLLDAGDWMARFVTPWRRR